jgi:hypothetical protein
MRRHMVLLRDIPFEYPPGVRQDFMIGTYSHFDKVHPMRTVPKPATPSVLKRAAQEIVPVYHYDGRQKAIGDYLETHPVTGLLIARGDTILFEHYRYARSDRDRLLSNSMAKTITAPLVGTATRKEPSARSTIPWQLMCRNWRGRNTVRRRCARCFTCRQASRFANKPISQPMTLSIFIRRCWGITRSVRLPRFAKSNTRDAPPNTRFAYASSEIEVLGLVVSRALHMPLADYLATRIWQKLRSPVRCRLDHRSNRARSGLLLLRRHTTRLGAPRIDVGR